MKNVQPTEKRTNPLDGDSVEVHHIFDTIQGEGPFVGVPATFIRLAGCNLACPLCDTDYTSTRTRLAPNDIVFYLQKLGHKPGRLVVITGGEPFRQNIGELVKTLLLEKYRVQIETNGTLYQDGPWDWKNVTIVCSPKTPVVDGRLRPFIHSYKYVAAAEDINPEDGLPKSPLDHDQGVRLVARPHVGFRGTVYLQPVDVGDEYANRRHTAAVVDSCMKFGHNLCLQIHKIVSLE